MEDENKTESNNQQPTNDGTAPPQGPELNINDLIAVRSILDVASQRGTFKAAELESVGKVYNKLNNFLETVTKKET